jgi:hypothetical protein
MIENVIFKNIILEENLIIKLKKTVMTIFQAKGFPRSPKTMKFRDFSLEILRGRNFL